MNKTIRLDADHTTQTVQTGLGLGSVPAVQCWVAEDEGDNPHLIPAATEQVVSIHLSSGQLTVELLDPQAWPQVLVGLIL